MRVDRKVYVGGWIKVKARKFTFLVTRFPSSSVNCSSVTDSPGMFLASSP